MGKSKTEKKINQVKNDINKIVDEAKDGTKQAVKFMKNKTK